MPPEFVVFLDENHCQNPKLLAVLEEAKVPVERLLEHFSPGTPDIEWLKFVGRKQWAVVTTDKAIRKRTIERLAVEQNAVRLFCFTSNRISGEQMGTAIRAALPRMRKINERQPVPFIATISPHGVVEVFDTFGRPKADLR